jgi:hypothetical protein
MGNGFESLSMPVILKWKLKSGSLLDQGAVVFEQIL